MAISALTGFDRMWADLAPIGRAPSTGGYRRFAWTRTDAELRDWFTGEAASRSLHAGQVSVADGTPLAAQKLARVLSNDPATGVMRHVDAGYDEAATAAAERGVRIPMQES